MGRVEEAILVQARERVINTEGNGWVTLTVLHQSNSIVVGIYKCVYNFVRH
jgi:hypothetical protein